MNAPAAILDRLSVDRGGLLLPHSLSPSDFAPLWTARMDEGGRPTDFTEPPREAPTYAFLVARSCELHAIGILDRVLLGTQHHRQCQRRREREIIRIAVGT